MFRLSNCFKLVNPINHAFRYQQKFNYSSGYANSWIINEAEPAKTNDITPKQVQNNNLDDSKSNNNPTHKSSVEFMQIGDLYLKRDDIRCIMNPYMEDNISVLARGYILETNKKNLLPDANTWFRMFRYSPISSFEHFGPFIFNKNKLNEIEAIRTIKGSFLASSKIMLTYNINGARLCTIEGNVDDDNYKIFQYWLRSTMKIINYENQSIMEQYREMD